MKSNNILPHLLRWTMGVVAGFSAANASAQNGAIQLSLKASIDRVLNYSPRVKMSEADRDAQIEKSRGSWADLGPRVKVDYAEAHFGNVLTQPTGQPGTEVVLRPEIVRNGSVTVGQPLTGLGALAKKAMFEETQLDLKEDGYRMARADVAFEIAESWLKAYQLERLNEIAQNSVVAVEQQAKDAAALERVGRLNHGDVLKLQLAVSEARVRATQTQTAYLLILAALREALGFDYTTTVKLTGDLPSIQDNDPNLSQALTTARKSRLDMKIARHSVELAEFGKSLAYSQFSPQVNLFAKLERNFGEIGAVTERQTRSFGVQLTWDIWNNGSHVFALREAAQGVVKATEQIRAAESMASIDVQSALFNFKASRESLNLAETAVKQAVEAYRIEKARFNSGARSATDVILAENSEAAAKGRLVEAKTNLISWYLKLQKSLGQEIPKV